MAYLDKFESVEYSSPQEGGQQSGFTPFSGLEPEWEWRPLDRIEKSIQESFGSLWAAGSALAETVGLDTASEWAAGRSADLFEQAAEKDLVQTDFGEIGGVTDFLKWGAEMFTSYLPDLGLMALGGAGLGTTASKLAVQGTGKKLTQQMFRKGLKRNLDNVVEEATKKGLPMSRKQMYQEATRRTARNAGAMLGVAGVEGGMNAGQAWLTDLETRGNEANPWAAIGAGVGSMAVTMLSPVNRLLAKGPKGLATNPATITVGEAGEEIGQELILMGHEAGIDPSQNLAEMLKSEEGILRLAESGVAGTLLGGLFGGGSSLMRHRGKREEAKEKAIEEVTNNPSSALESVGIDTSQDTPDPIKTNIETDKLEIFSRADQLAKLFEGRRKAIAERQNREYWLEQERLAEEAEARKPEDAFNQYEPDLPPVIAETIAKEQGDARVAEILQEMQVERDAETIEQNIQAQQPTTVTTDSGQQYTYGEEATYNRPEGQRRIQAAREIASIDWDNLDTNNVIPEETKQKLQSQDQAQVAEAKGEALAALTKSLDAQVKTPTNLVERKKVRDATKTLKAVQQGTQEPPKVYSPEVIAEVPQDVGPDVTELSPEEYAAQQEMAKEEDRAAGDAVVPRGTVQESYDPATWTSAKMEVDGKPLTLYTNQNASIIKSGTSSYEAVVKNEDGDPVRYGTFKSKGDAVSALEKGVDADTFYGTTDQNEGGVSAKTDDLYKLNAEQEKMYSELPVQKIIDRALKPLKLEGDTDAQAAVNEAILKSVKAFNPKGKKSLADHLKSKVSGAVKDIQKNQSISTNVEVEEGGTIEDQLTRDSKGEPTDTSLSIEKKKTATTKTVEVGEKRINLVKDGNQWYRATDLKREKPLGTNVTEVTKKVKKEEIPPVRKVSVEEYQKEKEAKEAKEGKKEEISEAPRTIRRTKEDIDKKFDEDISRAKSVRDLNKKVLDKVDTGYKALKYLEALNVVGIKNLRDKNNLKGINRYILSNTIDKLKDVPIKESSELKNDFPEVYQSINDKGGTIPPNFYYKGNIYINRGQLASKKDQLEVAKILTHEVVHAVTVREMGKNKELKATFEGIFGRARQTLLTKEELKLLKEKYGNNPNTFNSKLGEAKKDFTRMPLESYYALLDVKEFVSESFVNPDLQQRLSQIPAGKPKGLVKTLWDTFINSVAKVFNVRKDKHSLLSETIVTATAIMKVDTGGFLNVDISPYLNEKKEEPKKKSWEERVKVMEEKDVRERPLKILEKAKNTLADSLRDLGKSMTEVLRKVDRRLIRPVRQMEMKINEKNVEYQRRIKPFFDGYNGLDKRDKLLLDLTLINYNKEDYRKKADEVLKRTGLEKSFGAVREVLQEIYTNKESVGLNKYKDTPNYFPRRVKDVRGLMQAMRDDPSYGIIQAKIDSLGKEATQHEKEKAIMSMMNTGRFPAIALLDPTASKRRTIDTVSSEWVSHYNNAADALINHIYESNESIYTRKFFGDVNRVELVKRRDDVTKQLENEKLSEKKRRELVGRLTRIEDALDDAETEFNVGISDFLAKIAPDLSPENQDAVIKSIRARLLQKGMSGTWANFRNLSLISALGSPTSAITQIGDLAFSVYKYGPTNTVKAILGEKIIRPQDLDLSHSMKEFQSEGTAKWLDGVLRWSGLQFMDQFGKTTTMNSAIKNAQGMTLEQFRKEYGDILWEDTDQTYQDIQAGKNTELTRYFAFNELSNFQPVSLSEMPVTYLTAGNGRIFYALKSYNIKALNTIYRESVHRWRTAKNNGERAKAAADVGRLILLMTVAGATADELKDYLLGRDAGTFSDKVQDNLLKIALLSRYTLDKGWRESDLMGTLLGDLLAPPVQYVTAPAKDVASLFTDEPDFTTLKYLPWGKLPYNWFSPTAEKKDQSRLRKEIIEEYQEGASFSKVRPKINQYNAWARKNDENLINYSVLNKARARYNKEN